MDYLDKLFHSALEPELQTKRLVARAIADKLAALGVSLSDEQVEELEQDLNLDARESLTLSLDCEQAHRLQDARAQDQASLVIAFDGQDYDEMLAKAETGLEAAFKYAMDTGSKILLEQWESDHAKFCEELEKDRSRYEDQVYSVWGTPLDLLQSFVGLCLEAGSQFNHHHRPDAATKGDAIFDVLSRTHARACQIGREIICLLRAGYADGALARWRTLHEITVIGIFIAEHDEKLAERYLAHADVTNYRDACTHQEHCKALGAAPLPDQEIASLRFRRDHWVATYGKRFKNDYGWACDTLDSNRVTFADIERAAGLDYLRSLYKLANQNVHAGARCFSFQLGNPYGKYDLMLCGPSVFGLAEPGLRTAASMLTVTTMLLLSRPNLDMLAFAQAAASLRDRIVDEFAHVEQQQDDDAYDGLGISNRQPD